MPAFHSCVLIATLLTCGVPELLAQNDQLVNALEVDGQTGRAEVIHKNGRPYVDLKALLEMTGGSVTFGSGLIVLKLPLANSQSHGLAPAPPIEASVPDEHALSRDFTSAGIEAIASMREWASTLAYAIENNYHVTEDWAAKYREQAQHDLRLASSASSTGADLNGLQLLTNEFEAVRAWSDKLVQARGSMDTAKYAMSPGALRNEESSKKIIACGHFLASMLGSSSYKDDPSCH